MCNHTETTDVNKHRRIQLNLPHTPPALQPESNNRQTPLALAASTSYLSNVLRITVCQCLAYCMLLPVMLFYRVPTVEIWQ